MRLAYDPHSSTLYNATTGAAVAVLYDDLPAAERHALGRLFAAAEGMREALSDALLSLEVARRQRTPGWNGTVTADSTIGRARIALRATEPPA